MGQYTSKGSDVRKGEIHEQISPFFIIVALTVISNPARRLSSFSSPESAEDK